MSANTTFTSTSVYGYESSSSYAKERMTIVAQEEYSVRARNKIVRETCQALKFEAYSSKEDCLKRRSFQRQHSLALYNWLIKEGCPVWGARAIMHDLGREIVFAEDEHAPVNFFNNWFQRRAEKARLWKVLCEDWEEQCAFLAKEEEEYAWRQATRTSVPIPASGRTQGYLAELSAY